MEERSGHFDGLQVVSLLFERLVFHNSSLTGWFYGLTSDVVSSSRWSYRWSHHCLTGWSFVLAALTL